MVSCCVPCCKNRSGRTTNVHYYSFPKDEHMINKWMKACNVPPEARTRVKNLRVCSIHFRDSDNKEIPPYLMQLPSYRIARRIMPHAVPSQFLSLFDYPNNSIVEIALKPVHTSLSDHTNVVDQQSPIIKYSTVVQPPRQILQALNQNHMIESCNNKEQGANSAPESSNLQSNKNPCFWEHNYCQISQEKPEIKDSGMNQINQFSSPFNAVTTMPILVLSQDHTSSTSSVTPRSIHVEIHQENSKAVNPAMTISNKLISNPITSQTRMTELKCSLPSNNGNKNFPIKPGPVSSIPMASKIQGNNMTKTCPKMKKKAENQPATPDLCGSTTCQLRMKKALRAKDIVILKLINAVKGLRKRQRNEVNQTIRERLQHIFSPKQIQKILNPGKRVRWSDEDIASAMTLKKISTGAYYYLKGKNYPLPGLKSINMRRRAVEINPRNPANLSECIPEKDQVQNR